MISPESELHVLHMFFQIMVCGRHAWFVDHRGCVGGVGWGIFSWSNPLLEVLKFKVDRATRGKSGAVDVRGVLQNDKGVGVRDSSDAEVLAILEALRIFSQHFSGKLESGK